MKYAYFTQGGKLLTLASQQQEFPDPTIIAVEVPDDVRANAIFLDLETRTIRERVPFALNVGYNRVSNIPAGTNVAHDGELYHVEDGEIEFDANVIDAVWLHFDHPCFIAQYVAVPTGPEVL
ncbi:hypothetical protein [Sphingobium lactosutens]|uniref:Uncharacterized protein n=1 Tax=Sphingobium lactosutens DS20 TaxID=1331060 RepID=T0IHT2_9SPHN|nr:hypothetical protein [Sphingobium lactosutens]EQB11260.1 hypothetical protein RLDS_22930 [Sphingobium lactosutens DS20]